MKKRTHKEWTTREVALLREMYPSLGAGPVAKLLGRTFWSVNARASLLKVRRDFGVASDRTMEAVKARCRIDPSDADSCWIWRGHTNKAGHPYVTVEVGRTVSARRWVYELSLGQALPRSQAVTMTCSCSNCLNPKHMRCASVGKIFHESTNEASRVMRLTVASRQKAKLNADKAAAILASNESSADLARLYGVTQGAINNVRAGRTWRPLALAGLVV